MIRTHRITTTARSGTAAAGFTLLEVMIALIIFSVGLLGLAGLQAYSMNSNQTAYLRSIAMQQAYNMADRMRNNITGVKDGYYDAITTTLPSSPPDCTATDCTLAQLANFDAYEWNIMNKNALPDGQGTVKQIAGTAQYQIRVFWNEGHNTATGLGCNPSNPNDMKCYSMTVEP